MRPFAYAQPNEVSEVVALAGSHRGAQIVAGGTDILNLMRDEVESPEVLIDINRLALSGIAERGALIEIGALTRMRDASDSALLRSEAPGMVAALMGASPQIRNMASIGGNLLQRTRCPYFRDPGSACNKRMPGSGCPAIRGESRGAAVFGWSDDCVAVHASDLAVALTALDASVRVVGPVGPRLIAMKDLYPDPDPMRRADNALDTGEILVAVELPTSNLARTSTYLKVRDRASFGFALTSAAVGVHLVGGRVEDIRIVLGGVAPRPWRVADAEDDLIGRELTDDAIAKCATIAANGARPLPGNQYKVELIRRSVSTALRRLR